MLTLYVNTVKQNYKLTSHKYYKYKAKFFKTKKLNFWDRNAPYPKTVEKKISWKEARDIVLNSYYDFDPQAGDIAKMFFDKKWIHASVIKGKMSGAFSHPCTIMSSIYSFKFSRKNKRCYDLSTRVGSWNSSIFGE